ncbi:MAG: peptidylprolyl isomerase, partial [Planctomycetota bacterium]
HIILLRSSDPPNEFIPRTHAQSLELAEELREKINRGIMRFSEAARLYSEEPQTKQRGGQVGRLSAKSTNLPPEIMSAAFASPAQRVPEPVSSQGGVFLLWIAEIDPPPTDRQLIAAMRAELAGKLQAELFSKSQLIFTF